MLVQRAKGATGQINDFAEGPKRDNQRRKQQQTGEKSGADGDNG
jgi:hypothetical protein